MVTESNFITVNKELRCLIGRISDDTTTSCHDTDRLRSHCNGTYLPSPIYYGNKFQSAQITCTSDGLLDTVEMVR